MLKNVLITTQHRGVFFAQVDENTDLKTKHLTDLKKCRMAIYWGTTKGVAELAHTGPTNNSKLGAPADIEILHDVTAVFLVTEEAAKKWLTV